MELTFVYTETEESYEWELRVETHEALEFTLCIYYGFLFHLCAPVDNKWVNISTKAAAPPTAIKKGIVCKFGRDSETHINFIHLPTISIQIHRPF